MDAKLSHLPSFLSDIRNVDREEWVAGGGGKVSTMLIFTLLHKDHRSICRAVEDYDTGECLAMWGVFAHNEQPHTGVAWMACTNQAVARLHSMHSLFKQGIAEMHSEFPVLHAWAYGKNTLHHKWMKRFGFKDTGRTTKFALGLDFQLFTRSHPECVSSARQQ